MLGKKALQTGVNVVLAGENLKTAVAKQRKKVLGLPSQNTTQSGAGRKVQKGKRREQKSVRIQARNGKTSPQKRKPEEKFSFLK